MRTQVVGKRDEGFITAFESEGIPEYVCFRLLKDGESIGVFHIANFRGGTIMDIFFPSLTVEVVRES